MNRLVEKLWKSLRESLWGKCGKVLAKLWKNKFYTILKVILHGFEGVGESFADSFTHEFISDKWWFCTFSTELITTTTNF